MGQICLMMYFLFFFFFHVDNWPHESGSAEAGIPVSSLTVASVWSVKQTQGMLHVEL